MNIPAHFLSSWCLAETFSKTRKERICCVIAGLLPDFDGLGILIDVKYYHKFHHIIGHNFLVGLLLAVVLAMQSEQRRLRWILIYFGIFNVHMILDLLGSGPGWGLYYLWPFSMAYFESPYVWELQSWQNMVAFYIIMIWVVVLYNTKSRTPLEVVSSSLDQKCVAKINAYIQKRRQRRNSSRQS